jgi:preprotein translocase subunit YajC
LAFSLFLQAAPSNPLVGFLPILLIFGIFYFLLFLPMQKQRKKTQEMLSSLENGQNVLTSGGIVGTIVAIEGEMVILRVKPDGIKLQIARSAISNVVTAEVKK